MYRFWQQIKPLVRPLFGSEETFSFVKENLLLWLGFIQGMPVVYRHELPILLNFLHKSGEGVEVGVRDGAYSEILLQYSVLSKLYSIDPWRELDVRKYDDASNVPQQQQDELFEFTKLRLQRFFPRSEIMRLTSKEASSLFKNSSLDFVYIDANHSYEAVKEDLSLWWPKVKSGGIFAGHDYLDGEIRPQGNFGVKRAVDAFAQIYGQRVYATPEKWPTWYIVKGGALERKYSLNVFVRKSIREQYTDKSLWRQTRGIRSS